jgi:hypothetical protein
MPKNPMAKETYYEVKGKKIYGFGSPMTRQEVDRDIEKFSEKVKRNEKTARENPELKEFSDFANEGIVEQIRQARKANQAGIGAGRGEINPPTINTRQQYESEKEAGDPNALKLSFEEWKKL